MAEENFVSTLEDLDEKIRTADSGDEAKKYAEAYKAVQEADNEVWKETLKNDTERSKNKWIFWGTVTAAAIGALITGGLRIMGDLAKVDKIATYEKNDDIIINQRKY